MNLARSGAAAAATEAGFKSIDSLVSVRLDLARLLPTLDFWGGAVTVLSTRALGQRLALPRGACPQPASSDNATAVLPFEPPTGLALEAPRAEQRPPTAPELEEVLRVAAALGPAAAELRIRPGSNPVGDLVADTWSSAQVAVAPSGEAGDPFASRLLVNPWLLSTWWAQVTDIAAGPEHTCIIIQPGSRLRCWGANEAALGYGGSEKIGDDEAAAAAGDLILAGADDGQRLAVAQVVGGREHTCALLTPGGLVRCWGLGEYKQLGFADTLQQPWAGAAADLLLPAGVTQISSFGYHTCARLVNGGLRCWGRNYEGQLGYGVANPGKAVTEVGDVDCGQPVLSVAAGTFHTCILTSTRGVRCWGRNHAGQCGYGHTDTLGATADTIPRLLPDVNLTTNATEAAVGQLHAGHHFNCIVSLVGQRLLCWGLGTDGSLGWGSDRGHVGDDEVPADRGFPAFGFRAASAALGWAHACALAAGTGSVYCWGSNNAGVLGYGPVTPGAELYQQCVGGYKARCDVEAIHPSVPLGAPAVAIASGWSHVCAVLQPPHGPRRPVCWGAGAGGALGTSSTANVGDLATPVEATSRVPLSYSETSAGISATATALVLDESRLQLFVSASIGTTCVLAGPDDARVRCWGSNDNDQLGLSSLASVGDDELPTAVPWLPLPVERPVQVLAGAITSCVRSSSLGVHCWGTNSWGALGTSDTELVVRSAANALEVDFGPGLGTIVAICGQWYHHCGLTASGTVHCWGLSIDGRGGHGPDYPSTSLAPPQHVVNITNETIVQVSAGGKVTCAVSETGKLWCWGDHALNATGNPGPTDRFSGWKAGHPAANGPLPLEVPVAYVAVANNFACAIAAGLRAGEVLCWGSGQRGSLGVDVGGSALPSFAAKDAKWPALPASAVLLAAGRSHCCAVLELDRSLYCWGNNDNGALGAPQTVQYSAGYRVTNQVLGGTVASVSAYRHTCVVVHGLSGQRLHCTGQGEDGKLGNGATDRVFTLATEPVQLHGHLETTDADGYVGQPSRTAFVQLGSGSVPTPHSIRLLPPAASNASAMPPATADLEGHSTVTGISPNVLRIHLCPNPAGLQPVGSSVGCVFESPPAWTSLARGQPAAIQWVRAVATGLSATTGFNATVTIFGDLGWPLISSGFSWVAIGGRQCISPAAVNATALQCVAPAGIGRSPTVQLQARSWLQLGLPQVITVTDSAVRYAAPKVAAVYPRLGLWPGGGQQLSVMGAGFGSPEDHDWLRTNGTGLDAAGLNDCAGATVAVLVGGRRCLHIRLLSDSELTCTTPAGTDEAARVHVCIAGQWANDSTVQYQPLVVSGLQAPDAPTRGGGTLTVLGSGLTREETPGDFAWVSVGAANFTGPPAIGVEVGPPTSDRPVVWDSSARLRVWLPPGQGLAEVVLATTVPGQVVAAGSVAYNSPVLQGVRPHQRLAGAAGDEVTLAGVDLPVRLSGISEVLVGGRQCVPTSTGHDSLRCRLGNDTTHWPSPRAVSLAIHRGDGRVESFVTEGLFTGIPPPVLTTVVAASMPTSGGVPLRLIGDGLGRTRLDLASAVVGAREAALLEWRSGQEVVVELPPGVGKSVLVQVQTATGLVANRSVSYDPPALTGASPSYLLLGTLHEEGITVSGVNLPPEGVLTSDLRMSVGGIPCGLVQAINATTIQCKGIDARVHSWPSPGLVALEVASLSATAAGLVETVGRPVVAGVSPQAVAAGTSLLIVGRAFGRQSSDVLRVAIGPYACTELVLTAPTSLQCTVPALSPEAQALGEADPSTLRSLPVVVTSVHSVMSGNSSAVVDYSLSVRRLPSRVPSHLLAWRPVAQGGRFQLRWVVGPPPSVSNLAVVSFDVEVREVEGSAEAVQVLSIQASSMAPQDTIETANGSLVIRSSNLLFTSKPVTLRVRLVNAVGPGNWSQATGVVTESCSERDFLPTHLATSEWTCQSCPEGAYCGGQSADAVVPLPGFWRVPWSLGGVGFARCPLPAACRGFDPSSADNTTSSSPTNALTLTGQRRARRVQLAAAPSLAEELARDEPPAAVSDARLASAARSEGCAPGYNGTMCSICTPGNARSGAYECSQCASRGMVVASLVLVLLAALLVIWLLVANNMRTGSKAEQATNTSTAVVKLVISHLQTVSLAASFELEWPQSALKLFGAMASATAASSDVVGFDCLLQPAEGQPPPAPGQVFFSRSALVLSMPLAVLAMMACLVVANHCLGRREKRQVANSATSAPKKLSLPQATSTLQSKAYGTAAPNERVARRSLWEVTARRTQPPVQHANPLLHRALASSHACDGATMASNQRATTAPAAAASGLGTADVPAGSATPPRAGPLLWQLLDRLSISERAVGIDLTVWDKLTTTAVVTLFLMHMGTTKAAFDLVTCVSIDAPGGAESPTPPSAAPPGCPTESIHRRLAADLDVCCDAPEARLWMTGLGVPALVVYALGIPLLAMLLLCCRRRRLHHPDTRVTLGFLYAGFRDEAYYWESVVMLRKVAMAAIGILLVPVGVAVQTYLALLLLFGLTIAHMALQPFESATLNRVELLGLATAFLTFECGLFLSDAAASTQARVVATMLLVGGNVAFLLVAVGVSVAGAVCGRCARRAVPAK